MMSRRSIAVMLAFAVMAGPALAAGRGGDVLKMLDPDNDGTVDLMEAKRAAAALFAKLHPDRDGTLDLRELNTQATKLDLIVDATE